MEQIETTGPSLLADEVAKHLEVGQDSIYRWIEARGLSAHNIGRIWNFKLSDVGAWVRAGGAGGGEKVTAKAKATKMKRARS